jgi:D-alanyl-D-alanine dipeptidase
MEAGMDFIQAASQHPIEDECEPLAVIALEAKRQGVELELSPEPFAGDRPRIYMARTSIVTQVLAVASELREIDHTLVIEDAFRTYKMQRDLGSADSVVGKVATAILLAEPNAPLELILKRLSVVVQTRPKSAGHMAGAAVDVSVRGPDGEKLDRGGPYITVSEAMPMESPYISAEAKSNRRFVTEAMARHGFEAFPYEFWHYSCDDVFARIAAGDPRPARFGPIDVGPDGSVTPIAEPLELMIEPERLKRQLAHLVGREGDRA